MTTQHDPRCPLHEDRRITHSCVHMMPWRIEWDQSWRLIAQQDHKAGVFITLIIQYCPYCGAALETPQCRCEVMLAEDDYRATREAW